MAPQLKQTSAPGTGRQRMLKPLASVHGHSPLRLKLSIEDLDKPEPRRSPRKLAPLKQLALAPIEDSDDEFEVQSDEDKENVNPRRSLIESAQARTRQTKTPLAEIILIDDSEDDSHHKSTSRTEEDAVSDSDFQAIDISDDDDSLLNIVDPRHSNKSLSSAKNAVAQAGSNIRITNEMNNNTNDPALPQYLRDGNSLSTPFDDITEKVAGLFLEPSKVCSEDHDCATATISISEDINAGSAPQTPTKTGVSRKQRAPPPSKSRLNSPSKPSRREHVDRRIPPTPHRPSIDAFWAQDVVDSWNDEYSPKKIVGSPRKTALERMLAEMEGWSSSEEEEKKEEQKQTNSDGPNTFFSTSKNGRSVGSDTQQRQQPLQSPNKTPSKTTLAKQNRDRKAAEKAAKDEFLASREKISRDFLEELDNKITEGKIAALTADTGGVKIVWSVTLRSTAGRANWRREAVRRAPSKPLLSEAPTTAPGSHNMSAVTYRHVANIELATKVITTKDRLLNVVAHEFCHLANFMISNIKDQPHGKSFKVWASKVTREFADKGVKVTTKHDWDVEYKYEWVCVGRTQRPSEDRDIDALMQQLSLERAELSMDDGGCGMLYQRHSKSIDPSKHGCGKCKGKLIQIKPAPRKRKDT